MTKKSLQTLKLVAAVLIVLGLIGQGWSYGIWNNYFATLPRVPELSTGRVYALNMHGIVAYQTSAQRFRLLVADYSSTAAFCLGLLLAAIYEKKSQNTKR